MVAALTGLSIQSLVVRLRMARDRLSGVLNASTEIAFIATDPQGTDHGVQHRRRAHARLPGGRDGRQGHARRSCTTPRRSSRAPNELGIFPGYEVVVQSARRGVPEYRQWTYIRKDGSRIRVGAHDHRRVRAGRIGHRLPRRGEGRQRAPACRAGAPAGARQRRRGVAREVRVPGQHEPRDPHAAERRDGHARAADGHRADARPARVRAHGGDVRATRCSASSTTSSTSRRSRPASSSSTSTTSIREPWSRTRAACSPTRRTPRASS